MQALRDHRGQLWLLYPKMLSITTEGENKIFHDRTRFNQYLTTNPTLHKVLEGKSNPRTLASSTKIQKIDDITIANMKEGKTYTQ